MKTDMKERLTTLIGALGWSGPTGAGWWSIHADRLDPLLSRTEQAEAERDQADAAMIEWADAAERMEARAEAAESSLKERDEEVERLRDRLEKARQFVCMVIAFVGRDQGTSRIDKTLNSLVEMAVKEDAAARAALSHQGGKAS